MKQYLDERIDELRKKYLETSEEIWLHRFHECSHIKEKFVVEEIDKEMKDALKARQARAA